MRDENNEDGNGDGNESEGIKKKSLCMHDVPLRRMRAVFASMNLRMRAVFASMNLHCLFTCLSFYLRLLYYLHASFYSINE